MERWKKSEVDGANLLLLIRKNPFVRTVRFNGQNLNYKKARIRMRNMIDKQFLRQFHSLSSTKLEIVQVLCI